jgi:ABC-type transport system involved in multi-copper enzyme maturation permease subunit
MFLGPVFSLEMVTSARRTRYFWIRTLYACCLLGVMILNWMTFSPYAQATNQTTANFAWQFFIVFSYVQLTAILLLTPGMVAGTMALENERRTIEYLLTSQLGNAEIVLGKLGSRLLQVAMQVLVGLPILAIVTMLGGIEFQALVMVFVLSIIILLAVASLSMAISVGCQRAKDALIRTYVLVLAFLFVPLVLAAAMKLLAQGGSTWYTAPAEWVVSLNPYVVMATPFIPRGQSPTAAADAWWALSISTACYGVFSLVCILLATTSVRRVFLKSTQGGVSKRRTSRRTWIRPNLDRWPMIWKEIVAEQGISQWGIVARIGVWLLIIATAVPFVIAFVAVLLFDASSGIPMRDMPVMVCILYLGTGWQCFVLLLLAGRAACSITSEKERDCWTSLISTDLTPSEILMGKVVGNLYAGRWLLALPIFFWLLEAILRPDFLLLIPVLLGVNFLMALVATLAGIYCSLRCANSLRAMSLALPALLFVGLGYLLPCGCVASIIASGARGDGEFLLLVFTPCVPYLLVAPELGWIYLRESQFSRLGTPVFLSIAWIGGMIGYLMAAASLWSWSAKQFDELAGRTSITQPSVQPPVPGEV